MLQISSIWETLRVFFEEPTKEHYLIEISRVSAIAHTSIKKNLDKLVSLGLILKENQIKGKRKFPVYKANLESKSFKRYKIIYNQKAILDSGIVEYLEESIFPKCIVLFGSYQKGEDTEDSDIDIFIEAKEKKVNVEKFEKILKRKIQLHFKENFNSYPKELKNNIINGSLLYGFLEAYK